ncbi:hypothetical protein HanPSC8_Chr12g0540261 [Helianthus annuus]|nr:hypothetical protein HanPSC8_Chr12g0540261 [Helianthus annuus]
MVNQFRVLYTAFNRNKRLPWLKHRQIAMSMSWSIRKFHFSKFFTCQIKRNNQISIPVSTTNPRNSKPINNSTYNHLFLTKYNNLTRYIATIHTSPNPRA